MSHVEVRDYAHWAKHIYENEPLKEKILNLSQGQLIELVVDGWRGQWVKMDDGKEGRPTLGIKDLGDARQHWNALNKHRGTVVQIKEA